MRLIVSGCAVVALTCLSATSLMAAAEERRPAVKLASASAPAQQQAMRGQSCAQWAENAAPFNPGTAKVLEMRCKARRK